MTPLQMQILIHYAYSAEDYREGDFSAPAVREAIDQFKQPVFPEENNEFFSSLFGVPHPTVYCNLLEAASEERKSAGMCYQLTARGRMYVEALQAVPLPMLAWKMPEKLAA